MNGNGDVKGGIRGGVVEKCMSLAPWWGYNKKMEDPGCIMPLKRVKRVFADCLVRNMCLLLNVGPDRHGNMPPPVERRMREFGEWVNATSEAIYGTRGGPWEPVEGQYGFCWRDNMVYLYLLGEYTDDSFVLPPLDKGMKAKRAIGDPERRFPRGGRLDGDSHRTQQERALTRSRPRPAPTGAMDPRMGPPRH